MGLNVSSLQSLGFSRNDVSGFKFEDRLALAYGPFLVGLNNKSNGVFTSFRLLFIEA